MNPNLQTWLQGKLQTLRDQHLYKVPKILESPAGGRVRMDGREVVNLSSNNYLGLANHPKVRQAALDAVETWGVGAGAVRWIGGTMSVHQQLEERLAKFKHTEAVLVFSSGFTANSGCIPAVLTDKDVVISDELNHASIIDGVRLSPASYKKSDGWVYEHKRMDQLEEILKKAQSFEKRMIITDGVFSMDGDIAPLPQIVELAEMYDAFVFVDDAHASGVLGKNGAGTTSHFDLYGRVDIQLGTLSKALGVVGGYIAGSALLKDWLINRGRPYLFSTAHPPMVAAALIAALDVMETDPEPMRRLWENARWWKEHLQAEGFDTMGSETPITPVFVGGEAEAQEMERRLWEEGVYALAIAYPTVARGRARLRTMPNATHTQDDLSFALQAFMKVRDQVSVSREKARLPSAGGAPEDKFPSTGGTPEDKFPSTGGSADIPKEPPRPSGHPSAGGEFGLVPFTGGTPEDRFPSIGGTPEDKFPSIGGTPEGKSPFTGGAPEDKLPSIGGTPEDQFPSTGGTPEDKYPSTGGVPEDRFPSTGGVPEGRGGP